MYPLNYHLKLNFQKDCRNHWSKKGVLPRFDEAERIGPLEPVTPAELHESRPGVTSVWSEAGLATENSRASVKSLSPNAEYNAKRQQSEETTLAICRNGTITRKPRARHSSSIRTQLMGNWHQRVCFSTRGKQQKLFFSLCVCGGGCLQQRIHQREE